jgi:hypothetical protein
MGKRSTGVSALKEYKKPHKTKKRLEIKHAMLDAKAAKNGRSAK